MITCVNVWIWWFIIWVMMCMTYVYVECFMMIGLECMMNVTCHVLCVLGWCQRYLGWSSSRHGCVGSGGSVGYAWWCPQYAHTCMCMCATMPRSMSIWMHMWRVGGVDMCVYLWVYLWVHVMGWGGMGWCVMVCVMGGRRHRVWVVRVWVCVYVRVCMVVCVYGVMCVLGWCQRYLGRSSSRHGSLGRLYTSIFIRWLSDLAHACMHM